jgi:hypothetical protein
MIRWPQSWITDLHVARQPLEHVLGRACGLVLPGLHLLGSEERVVVAEGLRGGVADGGHAHGDAALDRGLVTADGIAMCDERAIGSEHLLGRATHVAHIRELGHETQGDLASAATDEQGQVLLDGRRFVVRVTDVVASDS